MRRLLCSLVFVVGCQQPSASHSLTESGAVTFTATVVPEGSPHLYAVELKWDSPRPQILHRRGPGEEEAMHLTEEGETSYRDSGLRHGTYVYTLGENEKRVVVPRDRVLDARHPITHIEGIGRLFLGSRAELIGHGRDIRIDVQGIVSEGAWIRAFPSNAAADGAGRAGGKLEIRAQWAHGTLHVDRSGENGGKGRRGLAGSEGASGKAGRNAEVVLRRYAVATGNFTIDPRPTFARADQILAQKGPGHPDVLYYIACDRRATAGSAGGRGGDGADGGRGYPGGDMMAVDIRVKRADDWEVRLSGAPGQGGEGGKPGPGGPGGRGGPSGARDKYGACPPPPPAGRKGPAGKAGKKGEPGAPGRTTPFCVQAGNHKEGGC